MKHNHLLIVGLLSVTALFSVRYLLAAQPDPYRPMVDRTPFHRCGPRPEPEASRTLFLSLPCPRPVGAESEHCQSNADV